MNFVHHDFHYNFVNASESNDFDAMSDILSQEIADIIVSNPDGVIESFKVSGIKVPKEITLKDMNEMIYDGIRDNDTLRKSLAFKLAEKNNLLDQEKHVKNVIPEVKEKKSKQEEKKSSADGKKKKPENKSWYQKINDIKKSLENFDTKTQESPTYERVIRDKTFDLVASKYAAEKQHKYRLEPIPKDRKIIKTVFVLGIIAFVFYKLYKMLPSEEEKMAMENGGNVNPPENQNQIQPEQQTQAPTPENTVTQEPPKSPYEQYDYSGKQ